MFTEVSTSNFMQRRRPNLNLHPASQCHVKPSLFLKSRYSDTEVKKASFFACDSKKRPAVFYIYCVVVEAFIGRHVDDSSLV